MSAIDTLPSGSVSEASGRDSRLSGLIAVKLRLIVPLIVVVFIGYVGLSALAGLDKGLTSQKVIGPLNLGFVLLGANYVLAWIVTLVYVHFANKTIDPLVEQIKTNN